MFRALILRDSRESSRKCSLTPLRGMEGIEIRSWVRDRAFELAGHRLLHPDGEPLGQADRGSPILLVDCSWRHLPQVLRDMTGPHERRSLPGGFVSAYPRRSRLFEDPRAGLASVEALFVASVVLGERRDELLDGYRFASAFTSANAARLAALGAISQA